MHKYAFAFNTSSNDTSLTFVSLMNAHCRFPSVALRSFSGGGDDFSSAEAEVEVEEPELSADGRDEPVEVDGGRAVYAT